jgi:hypothetical protein
LADPHVIPMPEPEPPIPDAVTITGQPSDFRLTANEMRRLKDETGRTMTELMGEEADDADRMQAMVWLKLRRDGHDATWDQAGDVAVEYEPEQQDPTSGELSKTSPDSAASGA